MNCNKNLIEYNAYCNSETFLMKMFNDKTNNTRHPQCPLELLVLAANKRPHVKTFWPGKDTTVLDMYWRGHFYYWIIFCKLLAQFALYFHLFTFNNNTKNYPMSSLYIKLHTLGSFCRKYPVINNTGKAGFTTLSHKAYETYTYSITFSVSTMLTLPYT